MRTSNLQRALRQLSPFSSFESVPEIEVGDTSVDLVVPAGWAAEPTVSDGDQIVLSDGSGKRRSLRLPAPINSTPTIESFGNLALIHLPCAQTQPEPAREPNSPARVTRHLGHRGAMGAA